MAEYAFDSKGDGVMKKVMVVLLTLLAKILVRLRYKVKVVGKEIFNSQDSKRRPLIIASNHVAEIDSQILFSIIGMKVPFCPLITERFYNTPLIHQIVKLMGGIPITDLDGSVNSHKIYQSEQAIKRVIHTLQEGKNVLIFPSGQLRARDQEQLGGRALLHQCVREVDDAKVVLVRISGLSGSLFSRVFYGKTPDYFTCAKTALWTVIKNGIFFVPKRKVVVEFEEMDSDAPIEGTKKEFNTYLEQWYNQYINADGKRTEREPLNLVSYSIFNKHDYPEVIEVHSQSEFDDLQVPKDYQIAIQHRLSEMCGRGVNEIKANDELFNDLGLDSLDLANIFTFLSEQFDIDPSLQPIDLVRVVDLYAAAMNVKKGTHEEEEKEKTHGGLLWKEKRCRPFPEYGEGETLIEVFLNTADRMGSFPAFADDVSGIVSYKKAKIGVIALAEQIKRMPGHYIGYVLPSSVGAILLTYAIMLAGKTPVPLNFTVGRRFLEHAMDLLDLKVVISSKRFLDRVSHIDLGKVEDVIVLFEDIRKKIHFKDKLKAALLAKKKPKKIMKKFGSENLKGSDTAVILFTSGTENLPKGVPLTHHNIISNHKSAIENITLTTYDVMLGALPFFHVFGFAVTGLLGPSVGLKVVFSPDPTDTSAMTRVIASWRVTITCLAPSFYSNLFRKATFRQLRSIRYLISGAEKLSRELLSYMRKLGCVIIEGYGTTETSPIISIVRPGKDVRGVGQPLTGLEVRIINLETDEICEIGEKGEIVVSGPSVFAGYFGSEGKGPFKKIDGKDFYCTGDIGYFDDEGYLYIAGRIKRFIKIGGEMISLTAIEMAIQTTGIKRKIIDKEDNVPVCVMADETQKKPRLVLFTKYNIDLDLANSILKEAGFARIYRIYEVRYIQEMPVLGTGKTSFRKLQEMLDLKPVK